MDLPDYIYEYVCTYMHVITVNTNKRPQIEGEQGEIHGRVWKKKEKERNVAIVV